MPANDDLRLAWQAHREGKVGRRDALLTLAVADASPRGEPWVHAVRDHLVAAHPGHLFSGSHHLDEAIADRRVIAALKRLRQAFPPGRVRNLVRRSDVARGPYTGRVTSARILLDDLLAPSRGRPRGPLKLGSAAVATKAPIPSPAAAKPTADAPAPPQVDPIVAFSLNVLLAVAMLCALVANETQGEKRAA